MRWERNFGPPGERPEKYWSGWLGDRFSIAPRDMGDLSCEQLVGCYEYATGDD